ncbi:TetR/AcrR family transcriptional regulator [Duganella guangzhouensis]|nr:TetR/AcrR family transcriptional regulator [Duganella guangzhouensis]
MDSQKSTPNVGEVKAPSRARGHARVAALLEAASAEFAEKGYDATTMTAIAARAKSSIGSLYQFFPTKDKVAGALMEQYVTELEAAFEALRQQVGTPQLAERLTTLFVTFRATHPAFVVLAETPAVLAVGGSGVRERMRSGVASILTAIAPQLPEQEAVLRATVVQHLMKAAVALSYDASVSEPKAAMLELQRIVRAYLEELA